MNLGSGNNGQFTFLDLVSLMSFCIAIMNFDENLSQSDKQEMMEGLSQQTEVLLKEIHSHLQEQDKKIDYILEVLNDNRRDI
jgi:hypothetical protein